MINKPAAALTEAAAIANEFAEDLQIESSVLPQIIQTCEDQLRLGRASSALARELRSRWRRFRAIRRSFPEITPELFFRDHFDNIGFLEEAADRRSIQPEIGKTMANKPRREAAAGTPLDGPQTTSVARFLPRVMSAGFPASRQSGKPADHLWPRRRCPDSAQPETLTGRTFTKKPPERSHIITLGEHDPNAPRPQYTDEERKFLREMSSQKHISDADFERVKAIVELRKVSTG